MDDEASARLSLALHAAVPPALFSILLNSIVTNKTFALFKVAGNVLPTRLRVLLQQIYVTTNACLVIGTAFFLHWHCGSKTAGCLPSNTIVAVVLLLLLWVDRIVLCFLHLPFVQATFLTRVARGSAVAGYLMALSERDATAVLFLVLSICNRWSGFSSKALPWIDRVLRSGIAAVAAFSFIQETASRRLSVLCVLAAIHSR